MSSHETKEVCGQHVHRYVAVWTVEGKVYDGIVDHVDDEKLYLAVPVGGGEMDDRFPQGEPRAFVPGYPIPPGGYINAYPSYPVYPPYGYPYIRRRFNPLILPLATLTAISLLPYY
ncbi:hypothetical protein Q5741_03445 [Paenibacillus sp. JX-17]|uniref:Phosphatidylinositol kinase n=1 Tax=Paenibacillus lacisoli TaxID=3064525 RepID=A0ABT9C875_9BACL|nr:hypothetical protein [Paenibacillus sp. JX-17]MDO7905465.1 hypothetical protein [Paenibacillus sp. JX-17]